MFLAGLVFLQYGEEVKRALLPAEVNSASDIKALFIRSFPGLGQDYLDSPHVKIYIQEPGKSELFYELDDLRYVPPTLDVRFIRPRRPTTACPIQSPPAIVRARQLCHTDCNNACSTRKINLSPVMNRTHLSKNRRAFHRVSDSKRAMETDV